jgi:hypothetical protein
MRIAVAWCACAALVALAGCGANDGAGTPGAESSAVTAGTAASSPGAKASGEETSRGGGTSSGGHDVDAPDTPVAGGKQGSASLPSLPIGGSVAFEAADSQVCAFLAWNGDDLPDGVAVRIKDLDLPAGVTEDSGASCDAPPCLGADSFTAEQGSCAVRLSWDGTASTDGEPSIGASGRVVCESQAACDQVQEAAASGGGVASVELPDTEEPESTGPSESTEPSESAEPSPSTEPSGDSPLTEPVEPTDSPEA